MLPTTQYCVKFFEELYMDAKTVILYKRNLGKVKDEKKLVIYAKGGRHFR